MAFPCDPDSIISAILCLYPVMVFDDGRQLSEPVEIAAAADHRPGNDEPRDDRGGPFVPDPLAPQRV